MGTNKNERAFVYRLGQLLLTILLGTVSFFLLLFFFWAVLIGGLFLIVFALILVPVFLPFKLASRHLTIMRIIFGIFALILLLMFAKLPVQEIQHRFDRLERKVAKEGPGALSFTDKLTVYQTNLIISISGQVLGFPEYARQSLRLGIGGGTQRSWRSDFALKSPKVSGVFKNWIVLLGRQSRDVSFVSLPARTVSWQSTADDRRVALALNPVKLEAKASPAGQRWRFDCRATTRMKYREDGSRVIFSVNNQHLILPEAPFWALQQQGWLKPFTVVWEWSFFSDDRRLKQ
ncbi:MAG TPA: hypothetical protein ENN20_04585 [Candidatus Marinimicrobia bacterium]|nr:hypothetical protein [Candidatus Neomarinimicrobiota bacterium]